MNNRFTQKAQHALTQALATAQEMGHTYVGTEHILMGLLLTDDSIACRILNERGVNTESTRELIASSVGTGTPSTVSAADMTPMTKKVIEESSFASSRMSHNYIGTEHLLLAIISETESFANKLIRAQNASVSDIKNDLFEYFGAGFEEERNEGTQKSTSKNEIES